jgi:transposase
MEAASPGERRAAIVELRVDGWSAKAIAGNLGVHRSTVYRTLERFKEEGAADASGLFERLPGRVCAGERGGWFRLVGVLR